MSQSGAWMTTLPNNYFAVFPEQIENTNFIHLKSSVKSLARQRYHNLEAVNIIHRNCDVILMPASPAKILKQQVK